MGRVSYNLVKDDEDDDEEEEIEFDQQDLDVVRNRRGGRKGGRCGKKEAKGSNEDTLENNGRLTAFKSLCIFIFLHLAIFTVGMCSAVIGPVLPNLQEQISLALTNVSWIFIGRGIGCLIGSCIAGILHRGGGMGGGSNSVRIELGWFALSMGALAMGMTAMSLCESQWELIGAVVIQGVAIGHIITAGDLVWRRCCSLSVICSPTPGTPVNKRRRHGNSGGLRLTFAAGALCAVLLTLLYLHDASASNQPIERRPLSISDGGLDKEKIKIADEKHKREENGGGMGEANEEVFNLVRQRRDESSLPADSGNIGRIGVKLDQNQGDNSNLGESNDKTSNDNNNKNVLSTLPNSQSVSIASSGIIDSTLLPSTTNLLPSATTSSSLTTISSSLTTNLETSASSITLTTSGLSLTTGRSLTTSVLSSTTNISTPLAVIPKKPETNGDDLNAKGADGKIARLGILKNLDAEKGPEEERGENELSLIAGVSESDTMVTSAYPSNSNETENSTSISSDNSNSTMNSSSSGNATSDLVTISMNENNATSNGSLVVDFQTDSIGNNLNLTDNTDTDPNKGDTNEGIDKPVISAPTTNPSVTPDLLSETSALENQEQEGLVSPRDSYPTSITAAVNNGEEDINQITGNNVADGGGLSTTQTSTISTSVGAKSTEAKADSKSNVPSSTSILSSLPQPTSISTISSSVSTKSSTISSTTIASTTVSSTISTSTTISSITAASTMQVGQGDNNVWKLTEGLHGVYLLLATIAFTASFFGLILSRCACFKTSCCSRSRRFTNHIQGDVLHHDDSNAYFDEVPRQLSGSTAFGSAVLVVILTAVRLALDGIMAGLVTLFVVQRFSWSWTDGVYASVSVWGAQVIGQFISTSLYASTRCRGFIITIAVTSLIIGSTILEIIIPSADINPPHKNSRTSHAFYIACAAVGFGSALTPSFTEDLPWSEALPWQKSFGGTAVACLWKIIGSIIIGSWDMIGPAGVAIIIVGANPDWFVHSVFVLASACGFLSIVIHYCCGVKKNLSVSQHSYMGNGLVPDNDVMETSLADSPEHSQRLNDDELGEPVLTGKSAGRSKSKTGLFSGNGSKNKNKKLLHNNGKTVRGDDRNGLLDRSDWSD